MKPCPFCGSTDINTYYPDEYGHHVCWCGNCGAYGPNDVSEAKAREMWNLRRPVADLLAACEAMLPFLEAFRKQLVATEPEEVGYCPACGPEDYCYNHQTQLELINVIGGVEEAITTARNE